MLYPFSTSEEWFVRIVLTVLVGGLIALAIFGLIQ